MVLFACAHPFFIVRMVCLTLVCAVLILSALLGEGGPFAASSNERSFTVLILLFVLCVLFCSPFWVCVCGMGFLTMVAHNARSCTQKEEQERMHREEAEAEAFYRQRKAQEAAAEKRAQLAQELAAVC